MPIYEYECQDCQQRFEALRRMTDADAAIACEHCGSGNTKRALSVFFAQSGGKVIAGSNGNCSSCTGGTCSTCGF
ncbi:MAG TPA: zinc ribbon domain-containing protein [Anaerolineae bacterium]|nr:zinc ribbon domain-containing protein [Anaerolineae bacterium]